ncbi:ead/Ea22-like family protein [Escherichia coli]
MSNIDKRGLREAAEKATKGRWAVEFDDEIYSTDGVNHEQIAMVFSENEARDAAFIAAANPATVLALLDELEAKDSTIAAQQHEIRMLLNALEEKPCPKCNDTGMADSGGTQPWGEPIEIECDCRQQDVNTAELVATGIITKVGE